MDRRMPKSPQFNPFDPDACEDKRILDAASTFGIQPEDLVAALRANRGSKGSSFARVESLRYPRSSFSHDGNAAIESISSQCDSLARPRNDTATSISRTSVFLPLAADIPDYPERLLADSEVVPHGIHCDVEPTFGPWRFSVQGLEPALAPVNSPLDFAPVIPEDGLLDAAMAPLNHSVLSTPVIPDVDRAWNDPLSYSGFPIEQLNSSSLEITQMLVPLTNHPGDNITGSKCQAPSPTDFNARATSEFSLDEASGQTVDGLDKLSDATKGSAIGPCSRLWCIPPRSVSEGMCEIRHCLLKLYENRSNRVRKEKATELRKRSSDDERRQQRYRGPFQDDTRRKETAMTRRSNACIRCRMQKIRVCPLFFRMTDTEASPVPSCTL